MYNQLHFKTKELSTNTENGGISPRVLLVALVMVFGRIIGSAPSNHVFGTKVENFARLWLVLSLGHPEFFPTGFRAKVREAHRKERRSFLPGICAAIPRCAIFLCMPRGGDFPQIGQQGSTQHTTHDFMRLFKPFSGFFFIMICVLLCIFKVIFALFFKSTLECFLHALRLYQISKLGYGMFSDYNVSFLHFYCLEVSSRSRFKSNHY